MSKIARPTAEQIALLKKTGDEDQDIAIAAQKKFAKALQIQVQENLLDSDNISQIFRSVPVAPGAIANFDIEVLATDANRKEYVGFTIPQHGYIPERLHETDTVQISTYRVANAADWLLTYARDARFDVVAQHIAIMEAGIVRKNNLDGWFCILAAAASRGLTVYDSAAPAGYFSKRLMTLMQLAFARQGNVHTTSLNPVRLTDLYVSPEGLESMRNWDLTVVDDVTRREIFASSAPGGLTVLFGVRLHQLYELGVGQAYQLALTSMGATLGTNDLNADGDSSDPGEGPDTQFVVGLDLSNPNIFVEPVREAWKMWEDPVLHRQQRQGYYGWMEHGYSVLRSDRTILGSF